MTKIINVQEYPDQVERTELVLEALKRFGYRMAMDEYVSRIEDTLSPDFLEKLVEGFKKHRTMVLGESGVAPLSMICYSVMKLGGNECGFYISRLRLGVPPHWGKDPELRIIIEDEDEFKMLWLQNYVRLLKGGEWDIVDVEKGPTEPGDIKRHAGDIPMRCDRCGNSDVNKMLVWYLYLMPGDKVAGGTTTLPKFLYESKYPKREKIHGAGYAALITDKDLSAIRIRRITCEACFGEGDEGETWKEIEPRRYGI